MSHPHSAHVVWSRSVPVRWEDAMVSGNGTQGFMAMGHPFHERMILCHAKCWVERCEVERRPTSIQRGLDEARRLVLERRFTEAHEAIVASGEKEFIAQYEGRKFEGRYRLPCNTVHPASYLQIDQGPVRPFTQYRREMVLDTGEVRVSWRDAHGFWVREGFASRPDGVVVVRIRPPEGVVPPCGLRLTEPANMAPDDIGLQVVEHDAPWLYHFCAYRRSAGKPFPDGYHVLGRIRADGEVAADQGGLLVTGASEIIILLRTEFLPQATRPESDRMKSQLDGIEGAYSSLLERHAAIHAEMMNRVRLDVGAASGGGRCTEEILAEANEKGMTPALVELTHAVGRYALISSSGELPPALMGIWGNDGSPPWGGRYTFDSNLNLAISAGSQGNLPEAMESYFCFIESLWADWQENARVIFGCRGFTTALVQDWRSGINPWFNYVWTGGAGWLYGYFYDHYLYTGDLDFLRTRVVPGLVHIAELYEDLVSRMPLDDQGRHILYPGISPENKAADMEAWNFPNASMDLAICRQVLTNLLEACRLLQIHADRTAAWEGLLRRLPDYRILPDGAIAEWSWPGIEAREAHRHCSHLYGVYPGTGISGLKTPELAQAARQAIQRRMDGGCAAETGHGLAHHLFFCARLLDTSRYWFFMDCFARQRFLNTSMLSCHNPGLDIYNLDLTLSMPAIIMEMLLHSGPGYLHLLPALDPERLPRGRVEGLLARGAIEVEYLEWDWRKRHLALSLRSRKRQTVSIHGPTVFARRGDEVEDGSARLAELVLPAGRSVEVTLGA